jgi:predicted ATPase/DNA-binding SARP family transcriptional activator
MSPHRAPVPRSPLATPDDDSGASAPGRHPERQPVAAGAGADVPRELRVLGEPRALAGGVEVLARRRKELALLAYLAASRRPVTRERLATLLWGDRRDERARHSLRQTLHRLTTALPGALEVTPDRVAVAADGLAYDAAAFEADVSAGRWEDALARWRGELLAGCDDAGGDEFQAWLAAERARLGRLHAAALQRLAESALAEGRWGDAAAWAARWTDAAPRHSAAAVAWIEALRLSGRAEEAAARHAEIAARWIDSAVEPSPEWRALGEALARDRRAPSAAPSADAGSAALFGPDLVGRAAQFAALASAWERVRAGGSAVVLVEGEPGLGKTRLCADFVARVQAQGDAWLAVARASDARDAGAWAVLRDALAGLERAPGIGGAPDWALAEMARLVPALRERFRTLAAPDGAEELLHEAVCRVLADVAAESPILLHVDDAAEADSVSTRLLAAVARRRIPGVMLLLAAGPGAVDLPGAERVALARLAAAETEVLVGSMLDLPVDERRRLAEWVHGEAGGNPSRSVEVIRALADDGRLHRAADGSWQVSPLATGPAVRATPADARFVARERELEQLEAALSRAVAGAGGVGWIAGEAGIGKTSLLRELARRTALREPRARVAWGECDALAGEGAAYLPFREIWRALREAVPGASGSFEAPGGGSVEEWFTAEVRRAAAHAPLVLVIDDLQWADASSLGLLFHLARRIADAAVLLVAAYRDADVAARAPGTGPSPASVVGEWQRLFGAGGIGLDVLDGPDALRLAGEVLETDPAALSPGLRERILRHTGGHPLFLVEAVHELRARGGIAPTDEGGWREGAAAAWTALPARVEGVIAERVRRLSPELRRLLSVAAVEGQVFTAEVVAEVAGLDVREVVRELGAELDRTHRLVAHHAVRRLPGGSESRYRFRHALFQAHTYGLLDAAERRYLHGDVGRALERLYGERWAEAAPRLARHFTEAGDDERAARHLHAAGTRAALASAHAEAAALFARAHDAAERSGQAGLRAAVDESAADSLHLAGSHAAARAAYEALLAAADGASARARLLRKLGDAWQAERSLEPALAAYGRARDALFEAPAWEGGDFGEWARLQVGWAQALLGSGRLGELKAFVRGAAEGVERYGTPGQRTFVLAALLRELSRREHVFALDALVGAFRTHAAEALGAGKLREQAGAEFALGFTQLWRGRLDDAQPRLEAALALAESGGERWRVVVCCTYLALLHRRRGAEDEVRHWTGRALAAGEELPATTGMARANEAWLAWRAGDAAAARTLAAVAMRVWAGVSPVYPFEWAARWPLLAAALQEDAVGEAVEHARAQLDPEQQPLPDEVARELALAVDLWESGDLPRTRAHLQAAVEAAVPLGFL